jgi:hypothetical protein
MDKPLLKALENYVAACDAIIAELAEGHYWNGSGNRRVKALESQGEHLRQLLQEAGKVTTPPTPTIPAAA